jgi:hypothetical protein
MADTVITPPARASFVVLDEPRGSLQNPDDKKFSVALLFPPNADLGELKKLAEKAVHAKFKGDIPKKMNNPFLDAEKVSLEADKGPYAGYDKGCTLIRVSTKHKPGFVDNQGKPVLDAEKWAEMFRSGNWLRCELNAFGYDTAGNKGVSFGLQNVQFVRYDEPLGSARRPAESVFGAIEGDDGAKPESASALFD